MPALEQRNRKCQSTRSTREYSQNTSQRILNRILEEYQEVSEYQRVLGVKIDTWSTREYHHSDRISVFSLYRSLSLEEDTPHYLCEHCYREGITALLWHILGDYTWTIAALC
jgi:hypothetical protein